MDGRSSPQPEPHETLADRVIAAGNLAASELKDRERRPRSSATDSDNVRITFRDICRLGVLPQLFEDADVIPVACCLLEAPRIRGEDHLMGKVGNGIIDMVFQQSADLSHSFGDLPAGHVVALDREVPHHIISLEDSTFIVAVVRIEEHTAGKIQAPESPPS